MPVTGTGNLQRGLGGAAGLGEIAVARSDDGSVQIDASAIFGSGIMWFGSSYMADNIYVNTNGSVSFGTAIEELPGFDPLPPIYDMIGAFWGDVDTRLNGEGIESGQIWVDMDTGTDTLSITWEEVGVYRRDASLTNSFQIQIADQGSGDVDVTLRYDTLDWSIGTANTDAGAQALLGGTRLPNPISIGNDPALLDTDIGNTGTAGLWFYEMRGGTLPGVEFADGLVLTGTRQNDILDGAGQGDMIRGLDGSDILRGNDGADWLYGGDGADTLNAGAGDDFIFGGTTEGDLRDVVYAGDGADQVDGGYGNDQIYGGAGNDTINGGFGADELVGQGGDDQLSGAALSDLIFGGDGFDFINGGFGHDRLNGGDGGDRFFHLGIFDHGSDWIQDYDQAEGDLLIWGGANATADDFQLNLADTANAGINGVSEVFVIYRPTGQIIWALVDGAAEDHINLRMNGETFDLMG
jgi:hypothetical protein